MTHRFVGMWSMDEAAVTERVPQIFGVRAEIVTDGTAAEPDTIKAAVRSSSPLRAWPAASDAELAACLAPGSRSPRSRSATAPAPR